ncbi:kinase-like protein [Sistotremastrum niveocremeum HHB9708]|uniref:dual-specificity kinase n=1 Tax=Sistotremastrum niveocremeum HHB9708 TaxID=1314777 RepID=A0A164QQ72_9AGAM|nr:kinase-like protein [Sistotremastrum niveocremeum HHB9708]
MGRRRGKTMSSTDAQKDRPSAVLPPMQMSALPSSTAQRLASLRGHSSSSSSSGSAAPKVNSGTASSRITAATASSMAKQSDASLRTRNQLPTIAGSPSISSGSQTTAPDTSVSLSSFSADIANYSALSGLPKETPTKIPRISGRNSATSPQPTLRTQSSTVASRRTSLIVGNLPQANSVDASPSPLGSLNEFGVLEQIDGASATVSASKPPARLSPVQTARQSKLAGPNVSYSAPTPSSSTLTRKANRDSAAFSGLRKSSVGSVASIKSSAGGESQSRFSALSPSKSLKFLTPKASLQVSRNAEPTSSSAPAPAASSSRASFSTPSPVPSMDDDEALADDEMLACIKRQHARKIAGGSKKEDLDELLKFPEPFTPDAPASPHSILQSSQANFLSEYERKEILEHQSIYWIGAQSEKKMATRENTTNNHGYDDERGDYLVVPGDHLAYRYEIVDTLGKGSFGQVLHCRDHCTGESVAIKIIRNKKRFHHQALVEIKILDQLRKWDSEEKHHVIKMTEHFYFRNHLCIAMELLSINLYELIKANGFAGFTTTLIRRFTSQMLASLSLMKHHRIVHCDLKPENVLLRHPAKSAIKVIDFGSSCFEHEKVYTYIQSRFYRSPEVILGMNYHMAIDMWSLGCILAELFTGFPIFPGENEQEQLSCIMEVLGLPDKELINRSSRRRLFFDSTGQPRPVVNSKGRRRRPGTKSLAQVLRCDDEAFVDFVAKCLIWDPERRLKPQPAMRHPFLTAGRRPKPSIPLATSRTSLLNTSSTRNKVAAETPKKSQIGAPTPLTARIARAPTSSVPATPISNGIQTSQNSSSRPFRASQPNSSALHQSSRHLNGYALASAK